MVTMTVAGVPPESGQGVGAEQPVADVFEGVVPALPERAAHPPLSRPGRCGVSPAGRGWPPASPRSAPVSRNSPRYAPSLVCRRWKNRRSWLSSSRGRLPSGLIASTTRSVSPCRSFGPTLTAAGVRICSPVAMSAGSNPARSTDARPFAMMCTCSGVTSPARCAAASTGRIGSIGCPVMLTRSPTCSAARTRRARLTRRDPQRLGQHPGHRRLAQLTGQVVRDTVGDDRVVEHRHLVPALLQRLQIPTRSALLRSPRPPSSRIFCRWSRSVSQPSNACTAGLGITRLPLEDHDPILLEHTFEYKSLLDDQVDRRRSNPLGYAQRTRR